jgi:hypothetical protein
VTTEAVDPMTGEVVPATHLAIVYANASEELEEMEAEVRKLRAEVADIRDALIPVAQEGPIDAGQGRKVVLEPPRRPSQRVSAQGAQRYKEELLTLGMGSVEQVFRPPTITAVRDRMAELIAHGIDPQVLAPEPIPAPPSLKVVTL